jgi:hypothetical protein
MFSRTINGYKVHVGAILIVCIVLIFIYGYILRTTKTKDVLAKEWYNDPVFANIDGWSFTHFFFFMLLGYIYPGHYKEAILAGVGWEIFESTLGQNQIKISGKRVQMVGSQSDGVYDGNDNKYWYGKGSDIIMDVLGYVAGDMLAPCKNNEELLCKL